MNENDLTHSLNSSHPYYDRMILDWSFWWQEGSAWLQTRIKNNIIFLMGMMSLLLCLFYWDKTKAEQIDQFHKLIWHEFNVIRIEKWCDHQFQMELCCWIRILNLSLCYRSFVVTNVVFLLLLIFHFESWKSNDKICKEKNWL